MSTAHRQPDPLQFAAWIGIDWADQEHAVCVVDAATGSSDTSTLVHEPGAIDDWAAELQNRFPGPIARRADHTELVCAWGSGIPCASSARFIAARTRAT